MKEVMRTTVFMQYFDTDDYGNIQGEDLENLLFLERWAKRKNTMKTWRLVKELKALLEDRKALVKCIRNSTNN